MEGKHRITETLNRIVKTATQLITPSAGPTDIRHIAETQRPGYSHQLLDWSLRIIAKQARRTIFPAIVIGGSQPQRRTLKDFQALCERIRWSIILFLACAIFYMGAVTEMLPPEPLGPSSVVFLTCVLLALAFRLQRAGLTLGPAGRLQIAPESVNPDAHRRQLAHLQTLILFGDFNPSRAPFRSGAIALTALLMVFAPSYPVIRWLNGYPLPAGVTWAGIAVRFVMVFVLFAWFGWIWKASKLAAAAFQEEIDALDDEARSR